MKLKISVLITTFNSSKLIEKALKSVEWCDEIIVVDSFSTDDTLEIAKKFNAKIFEREYQGSSRQLEYGVSVATTDFVLILDSDEEISPDLKNEIQLILESGKFNEGGYKIPRQVYFLGKWIKYGGWGDDFQYRLIKKSNVTFKHNHDAHWGTECKFPYHNLTNFIHHYTYENLFDYLGRINIYSSLDVRTKVNENPNIISGWKNLIVNPLSDFLKMYISKKGYKDGMQGFVLAMFSALHKMTTYAKLWEYQHSKENGLELPPVTYAEFKKNKKN